MSLLYFSQFIPSSEEAIRILYTGSGFPLSNIHFLPAIYHRYHLLLNFLILGPVKTNGSSIEYDKTGPGPNLLKVTPPSLLRPIPIATLNGTDSHLVHPP